MCEWLLKLTLDKLVLGAFVGALWSFLVERIPKFGELSPIEKRVVMIFLCLSTPVIALLGAVRLACEGAALTPDSIVAVIAVGCAAFLASQGAHIRKM